MHIKWANKAKKGLKFAEKRGKPTKVSTWHNTRLMFGLYGLCGLCRKIRKNSKICRLWFLAIVFVPGDYAAMAAEAGLVAWWKTDDGSGIIAEDSAGEARIKAVVLFYSNGTSVGLEVDFSDAKELSRADSSYYSSLFLF